MDQSLVDAFNSWIENDFMPFDITRIVSLLGISINSSSLYFVKSFSDYIQQNDIENAKKLIISREKSIKKERSKLSYPDRYPYINPIHYYKLDYRYGTIKNYT